MYNLMLADTWKTKAKWLDLLSKRVTLAMHKEKTFPKSMLNDGWIMSLVCVRVSVLILTSMYSK